MKDKFPEIFKTKIDSVKSKVQKEYYYRSGSNDETADERSVSKIAKPDKITLVNKINSIFTRPDFVYQADITIMYKNGGSINEKVVGVKDNYLLTLNGEKIYIEDIYDIK